MSFEFSLFLIRIYSEHRQGCYSQEGDIVVLCAYLGQLAHVRDVLASEVAVVIDERDQMALADQEAEKEDFSDTCAGVERVQVAKRVRSIYDAVLTFQSHLIYAGSSTHS